MFQNYFKIVRFKNKFVQQPQADIRNVTETQNEWIQSYIHSFIQNVTCKKTVANILML